MSTQGWRKNTSVISKLTEQSYNFSFLQAVRLLERSTVLDNKQGMYTFNNQPVATFNPPGTESVRFRTNHSLNFSSSEISKIVEYKDIKSNKRWDMSVNFMGLTGSQGVLPFHYTFSTKVKKDERSYSNLIIANWYWYKKPKQSTVYTR